MEVSNMFFDYLKKEYGENEPIFVSEIEYQGYTLNNIRQQIKKLTDAGKLKRYDTGIYFIPSKTIFRSGSQLSIDDVIERKYMLHGEKRCGYICGVMFANQLGLTSQVPMIKEIATNKATNDYRELKIASSKMIIRKPKTTVTEENYRILQLLDLLKDIDYLSELTGEALTNRLLEYMDMCKIDFQEIESYLSLYPDKLYRNLYEVGLLHGISA